MMTPTHGEGVVADAAEGRVAMRWRARVEGAAARKIACDALHATAGRPILLASAIVY
jgi:hypothetical protein